MQQHYTLFYSFKTLVPSLVAVILACICSPNAYGQTDVYISPDEIMVDNFDGWGTSLAWWGEEAGKVHKNDTTKLDDLAHALVNELNFTIFRYNIGGACDPDKELNCSTINQGLDSYKAIPNMNEADRGLNQRRMLKAIARTGQQGGKDLLLETFSNSPPYWMTISGSTTGGVGGSNNLDATKYDDFAEYLVRATGYIDDDLAPYGFQVDYIEPFNEPEEGWWQYTTSGSAQEGCSFSRSNQVKMINALQTELANKGSAINIAANDNFSINPDVIKHYKSNDVFGKVDKLNFHDYSGNNAARSAVYAESVSKDIWISEGGLIGLPGSGYTQQINFAARICEDLKYMRLKAWVDWQVVDKADSWTAFDFNQYMNNGVVSRTKGFYLLEQFSGHILEGYDLMWSTMTEGNLVAFRGPGKLVIVMVNNGSTSKSYNVDLGNFSVTGTTATHWRTSNTEDHALQTAVMLSPSNVLSITLPSQSISTFEVPVSDPQASQDSPAIADGIYRIINKTSSGRVDVDGASGAAGANIEINPDNGSSSQLWEFTHLGNSEYQITNVNSGLSLDVAGESTASGANVIQYTWSGNINQLWKVKPQAGGYFTISPVHAISNCLHTNGTSGGSNVNVQSCISPVADSQLYQLELHSSTITSATYTLTNFNSGKLMEVQGNSTTNGANIHQWQDTGADNQQWEVTALGSGEYRIINVNSQLSLDISGVSTADGANVIQWQETGGDNQKFRFVATGDGHYTLRPVHSNKCLSVNGGGLADGTNIIQWLCNGANDQKWTLTAVSSGAGARQSTPSAQEWTTYDTEGLSFFPNPVSEYLTLRLPSEIRAITVYDQQGRVMLSENDIGKKEFILDVRELRGNAFYFIRLTDTPGGQTHLRFLKE